MVHVVVALRSGGYVIDSGFHCVEDLPVPDGGFVWGEETSAVVKNPVRLLELVWQSPRIVSQAREVWCNDWVLDCDTGSIVLNNDWTTRSPIRRRAVNKAIGKVA